MGLDSVLTGFCELMEIISDHPVIGLATGILQVGNLDTIPVPVDTIPVSGTGAHRTIKVTVSYETRGYFSTHGLLA